MEPQHIEWPLLQAHAQVNPVLPGIVPGVIGRFHCVHHMHGFRTCSRNLNYYVSDKHPEHLQLAGSRLHPIFGISDHLAHYYWPARLDHRSRHPEHPGLPVHLYPCDYQDLL